MAWRSIWVASRCVGGVATSPGTEELLYRPVQSNQALEHRSDHGGIILKRAVEMDAHQGPRIVKQGATHRFNFTRPFLNLKFDLRIPWLYSHNQSPVSVKVKHSMIIHRARTVGNHWRTVLHQLACKKL